MAKKQISNQQKPKTVNKNVVTVGRLKSVSDSLKNQAKIDGRIGSSLVNKGIKNGNILKQDSASNMNRAKKYDSLISKAKKK